VVIPTRDRPGLLDRCLGSLDRQTISRDRFETIVVDDGSSEDLGPALARHPDVRLIRRSRSGGPAAARNAGWRAARGEAVVFLDDDVEAAPDLLAVAAQALSESGNRVAGIEGRVRPEDVLAAESSPFVRTLSTDGGGHTGNIVYWKSALQDAGGFDEAFPLPVAEDYDLAYRILKRGRPIIYDPRLRAVHAVRPGLTLREEWRRRGMARPSVIRLFLKHPDRFPPRFVPERLWCVLNRLMSKPSLPAVTTYFLLQDAVSLVAHRRLVLRRPALFARWAAFQMVDGLLILASLPRLSRAFRAVAAELGSRAGAGRP
jgi:glycosyltransferase involved in cell wall biosynthesis